MSIFDCPRGSGGLHRVGAVKFLSCTAPSVKRTSCGPRVPLFPLHASDLDAHDAEGLVLKKQLLDVVDEPSLHAPHPPPVLPDSPESQHCVLISMRNFDFSI